MNKKFFIITALLCLIIGMSAVSAETIDDNSITADESLAAIDDYSITADESLAAIDDSLNSDNQNLASAGDDLIAEEENLGDADSNVLSDGEARSFSQLLDDMNGGEFNIQSDYKFNPSTDADFKEGLQFTIDGEYLIEGNNHVIDASRQAGIFRFTHGTVYINNLKFINANMSALILKDCRLYTTNVTFENNSDKSGGAAVYADQSDYFSNNDKFINNNATNGAAIYAGSCIMEINNSTFENENGVYRGMIYSEGSITTVNNTVFSNMTSKYATAIYCEGNTLKVYNSKFINLRANNTAGAVGFKSMTSVIIDGCSFINATSTKNAGAVWGDINGEGLNPNRFVTIRNSLFENCSSEIGGAYVQLGGQLNLVNSNFTNNFANYSAGAIYVSNTTSLFGNSKFVSNKVDLFFGGAMYVDDSDIAITSCDFINNSAEVLASGIYLYDSKYEIKNSYFSNNGNYAIASYFDRTGSSLKNNEMGNCKTWLNQEEYTYVVNYTGQEIILNPTVITNENASSSRFDLRDYNLSGVVKDQGQNGACWAFGATGALESAFLKATGILLDISENNIQNSVLHYGIYGTSDRFEGGFSTSGMGLFLSWIGTINTEYDTYDELGKLSITAFADDAYHIQDCIIIPKRKNALDNAKLKDALINYGGLTVHLYGASANNDYYNPVTHAQYYNGNASGNHFVTLVGWDDNYSKDNFKITPPGDGAWICKNSWGTNWGENGYFYVSYYDTTFAMYADSVGYIINNTERYERSYQYDIGDFTNYYNDKGKEIRFNNTYNAIENELISAVGTYFPNAGENYTVTIYVDGDAVYSQNGVSAHGGFETIKLNKQIAVNAGHDFTVEMKRIYMPFIKITRLHFEKGKSFLTYSDNSVQDLGLLGIAACLKAYAFTNPNPAKTNNQYYNKNSNLTISSNANGKIISILKDNKMVGSATVTDGKASFNFTLEPGCYSIITSYDEGDIVEIFEVMNTIEVIESATIGYNTPISITAKFMDDYGVELFNEEISFDFDGTLYKGLIDNNKGLFKLTLSKLSIGTHTVILQNPVTFEEVLITINVVSRFSGDSNVNMYYADGSSFKARIYGKDGKPVGANQIVTIKLNKHTYKVKTNSKGYITFKIPNTVKPGSYALTASYAGETIKHTVKVKKVLKLAKVKVKKSAKKLIIKATLKKGKTPIKNKKLTFKFNGRKYPAKTNKKGIAKITVKKAVLKKLKAGKKVKYQVTYLKNTVKISVKVKK